MNNVVHGSSTTHLFSSASATVISTPKVLSNALNKVFSWSLDIVWQMMPHLIKHLFHFVNTSNWEVTLRLTQEQLGFQTTFPNSITTCVGQWTEKVECVVSVLKALDLHLLQRGISAPTAQKLGIPLMLLVEVGPLSVFYLFVLFFHIQMTSAPMTCFILYCHCVMYFITSSVSDEVYVRNDAL